MSSILTNNGAMVALQTLRTINSDLGKTQSAISTGKEISSAKDNSAVWAISKVMESDVNGFKAISSSLALGESTVAVARNAAETITDLLTEMKGKIVAAQEDNVDRSKINDDVTALKDQINSVVAAAQFNGLNLVDGSSLTANILSSLDRDSNGGVTASSISVAGVNFSSGAYASQDVFSGSGGTPSTDGDTVVLSLDKTGGNDTIEMAENGGALLEEGDVISISIGDQMVSYTIGANDLTADNNSPADIAAVALKAQIENLGIAGLVVEYDAGNAAGTLNFVNNGAVDLTVTGQFTNAAAGDLGAMGAINVSTGAGATAALAAIETLIGTAIDAAASFGSSEGRIAAQATFISNLTDSLKSGIGAMVDANMEATSARLQALQVQQQLAVQSLSIANQAPQTILSLFR